MAGPKPPDKGAAPDLSAMRCTVDDNRLSILFKPYAFDPQSRCVTDLRRLIGFAAFLRVEHGLERGVKRDDESVPAPTRERIREGIERLRTDATRVRRRLASDTWPTAPQSSTGRLRARLAALDEYTLHALNTPTLLVPSEGMSDVASLIADLSPASRHERTIERTRALTALHAFDITATAALDLLSRSTTKRGRVADRQFLGRSLAQLHARHRQTLATNDVRGFVASVLDLADCSHPDPSNSRSAFDEAIFGAIEGRPWLDHLFGRV